MTDITFIRTAAAPIGSHGYPLIRKPGVHLRDEAKALLPCGKPDTVFQMVLRPPNLGM